MTLKKITIDKLKRIGEEFGVKPCRIKGTEIIQIRKKDYKNFEDISWDEFEKILKKKLLAVYKSEKGNFLKMMKDR